MSSPHRRAGRRGRVILATVLILVLVGAAATGAWLLWSGHRVASQDREIAALKSRLSGSGGNADEHYRLGLHLCEREGAAEGLAHLELAAERAPASLVFGNAVRVYGMRFKEYDRSIRFFHGLVAQNGGLPEPRVQLALAYVDKMPDHMMGIVGQGKLSKQSIALLTEVLEAPEGSMSASTRWAALYALGMNHLYWPKALRHAAAAEVAFRRCLDYQKTMRLEEGLPESQALSEPNPLPNPQQAPSARTLEPSLSKDERASPELAARDSKQRDAAVAVQGSDGQAAAPEAPVPAYFMLPYLGLGDALVKEGRLSEAREVWSKAQRRFPREPRLAERLAMQDDDRLTDLIDNVRGLGVVVDTDLSILWGRRP